jgi:membrane protease subunit (stomatin/prohibitin family)
MGMGFGMAQQMANQMAQAAAQGAQIQATPSGAMAGGGAGTPPPPPGAPAAIWFLAEQGRSLGPFSAAQLAEMAARGQLRRESHVWRAGFAEWRVASEVPEVGSLLGPPPAP